MGSPNSYHIRRMAGAGVPRNSEVRARSRHVGISLAVMQEIAELENLGAPELAMIKALELTFYKLGGHNWLWDEEIVTYSISRDPLSEAQHGLEDTPVYLLTVTTTMQRPHET